MKIDKLDFIIMLPMVAAVAITFNYNLLYLSFVTIILKEIAGIVRKNKGIEDTLVKLLIYSAIMPDNFIILIFSGLWLLYYVVKAVKKRKLDYLNKRNISITIFIAIYFIVNILVNRVPVQNILLYFLYNFTFICVVLVMVFFKPDLRKEGNTSFNTILVSEMAFILVFIPFNFQVILNNLFGDWAVGTFGNSGGVQLFNLFIFGAIKFLGEFMRDKKLRSLLNSGICIVFSLTTVSVATTMLFFSALGLYVLLFVSSPKIKIALIAGMFVLGGAFYFTSHPWVRHEVISVVVDPEFRNTRVKKLKTYEDTFLRLPKKNVLAGIIGTGAANYSSRAALTASGYYATWYNKDRFPTEVAPFARKFIRPRIYERAGLSVVEQPTSQFISIMGEYGYIGVLFAMGILARLFYKCERENKLTILYFTFILFLDNYLEFPKTFLFFALCYLLLEQRGKELASYEE